MTILDNTAGGGGEFLSRSDIWRVLPAERWILLFMPAFRWLIWRRLAPTTRQSLVRRVLAALAPTPANCSPAQPIYVVGYFGSTSGIGEGARLTAESLASLGYDIRTIDISRLFVRETLGKKWVNPPVMEKGRGTLLLHCNPDGLSLTLPLIGAARVSGKRVVGYWSWELERIPDNWIRALRFVDEVWTPSQFVSSAIQPYTDKPIRVIPHPVAIRPHGRRRRKYFGLADGVFVALCMFSFSSSFERKNPIAAIRAFRELFGASMEAQLVLKMSDANRFPEAARKLRQEIADASNIRILHSELDRKETRDLVASVDVVLSLHRSEGFGLVMAEAMHNGIPVIATNWSGNLDYMDKHSAALVSAGLIRSQGEDGFYSLGDQVWADPSIPEAASWLKKLAADPEIGLRMSARAQKIVAERLGLRAFENAVMQSIGDVHRRSL